MLLTIKPPGEGLLKRVKEEVGVEVKVVEWRFIYKWLLNKKPESAWADRVADYLEVVEARLIEEGKLLTGTMTAFSGFGKGDPCNDLEAKRVLRLAMDELRKRKDLREELRIDPARPGRTGPGVWDCLLFDSHPKGETHNATKKWTKLKSLDEKCFSSVVEEVLKEMRRLLLSNCPGAEPRLSIYQRHWRTRSGPITNDAGIRLDLRATRGDKDAKIKPQPEWLDGVFDIVKNKKSNIEMSIGVGFPHCACEGDHQAQRDLDRVAAAWIACKPFLEKLGVA